MSSAIIDRFVGNVIVQLLKMVSVNVNKIQTLKYGEYGDSKYIHSHIPEKGK